MRRSLRASAVFAVVIAIAACQDRPTPPTAPATAVEPWIPKISRSVVPGACVTIDQLFAEADTVFSGGGPNANSVKSKIKQIDKANKKGDKDKATDAAFNAVRFIFRKFRGPQPLAGTPEQVGRLISHIFCFAGLDITVTDPTNADLVDPSGQTQVVKNADATAGTQLPPGAITEPTVLEFKKLPVPQTLTRLDQYPGFFVVTSSNASGSGPGAPVVVAICPDANIAPDVRARLRLGHQKTAGFEITPPADASFLECPVSSGSASSLPGWVGKALSKILPQTLYAAEPKMFFGGVGGLATEFSPFAPIDPMLSFTGGVGGLATEFKKTGTDTRFGPRPSVRPTTASTRIVGPGTSAAVLDESGCPVVEAIWGIGLTPNCRPSIVIRTAMGTLMRNVPVTWNVTGGGGAIAPNDPFNGACGTFGTTAATTTADSVPTADITKAGKAGVCWTMGPTPGTNTVAATPGAGGDAPDGVTFTPATSDFTAQAIKATPDVALSCPESVPYNGADQTPCTAVANDAVHTIALGPVPVTYGPTTPPRNAGTYTADATFAATTLYNAATAHVSFVIAPAATMTLVSCSASAFAYTGAAIAPCTATVTGAGGLSQSVGPVSYYNNVSPGAATASATFAATANYEASAGGAAFLIVDPATTWAATGPGTVNLLNDGSSGSPSMSYADSGSTVYETQTWTFSTTAGATSTITRSYDYSGFHAFFQVRVFVHPFVVHSGIKTYLTGVDQGPIDCCTPPSGGFTIKGAATFNVSAGDTYGFEIGGSNSDSNAKLSGTFTLPPDPVVGAYTNHLYDSGGHNCWHNIVITRADANTLRWTNSCAPIQVTWLLHATSDPSSYTSGSDYPYYGTPADVGFTVTFGTGGSVASITGPSGEPYIRNP